ncbi:unnamed protein product, partial [Hymenolepis diminuta]
RVFPLFLIALLCEAVRSFSVFHRNPESFDANNTVTISLPNELFIDCPNRILIHSLKPIDKVTVNMTSYRLLSNDIGLVVFEKPDASRSSGENGYVYDLKYNVPIELKPGSYLELNITYYYYSTESCQSPEELSVKSVQRSLQMVNHYVYILGETDKPLYRPGETVKFRFVALTRRNILPSSESPTWPSYQALGEYWSEKTVVKLEPKVQKRRTDAPYFDLIEMKDPLKNLVQQWKDVKTFEALNLNHSLISDAAEGKWTIVAHVQEEIEEIAFQVRHYVLPRFQAQVTVPKEIKPEDVNITFSVCASYTNGPAMSGVYDAQICICSQRELSRQQDSKKLMPKNECKSNYKSLTRQCMRFNGILGRTPCTNITANITKLIGGKLPGWNDKLGVFVEVSEETTGLAIVVSNTAEFKMWPEPKLELKMLSSFRPGFPVFGHVIYRNNGNSTEDLELIVREDTNPCGGWMFAGSTSPVRHKRLIPIESSRDKYKFVLPPLDFENPASVVVRQIKTSNGSNESDSPEINGGYFSGYWLPRPRPRWDLEAHKRLELWDGNRGLAIQVRVVNKQNITCPGKVKLLVFSNERLPDNTSLMLRFLKRGQLTTRTLKLQPDYTCNYEHYKCKDDDNIICRDGWTGPNCLTPVCNEDCGRGGICVAPNRCACKPGWNGESCEICIPRSGCKNGDCVEGGDCVCRKGFAGYLCETAAIDFEMIIAPESNEKTTENPEEKTLVPRNITDNTPRRTVFKHVANLELDSDFGPELRAVVFISVEGKIATDYLQIENIQSCSSPTLAKISQNGGGLQFSKKVVAPGELVNITLNLTHGYTIGDNITDTCLLRTIDVAMENFNTAGNQKIDFEAIIDVLKGNRVKNDPNWISNSESAYRAAGIDFTHITSKQDLIKPIIICPMYSARMGVLEDHSGPLRMANKEVMMNEVEVASLDAVPKPRLRDFFPEIWLFESVMLTNRSFEKSLTVPDSLTSWEANAVCFLSDRGLWAPALKPTLTVRMPFFVEFAPPIVVRRGEILHLPITIFLHPDENPGSRTCYEVEVKVKSDPKDWRMVGASVFSACICSSENGQQTMETFRLPMRPLRIGQLNLTAVAIARRGTGICDDEEVKSSKKVFIVSDAVRRSIRVEAEGVEKRVTVGGTFCSSGNSSEVDHELKIELQDKEIVDGSLRSYIAVGGSVIGRALSNLDSLVQMPTGCGEQNLVKVAPSVYVLKYLLSRQNASELRQDSLARKAAGYIISGFDNELKYQHPNNGAFSTFGPRFGANGSTWLTAYVFEVFSEADSLPLSIILDKTLNAHLVLSKAFDFLVSQQQIDGCFVEAGNRFIPFMRNTYSAESKLQLTSHVLAALRSAGAPLKEAKAAQYSKSVRSAIECIKSSAESFPLKEWPTLLIAKVLYATKKFQSLTSVSMVDALINELKERSKTDSTISGSLKWWSDSEKAKTTSVYYAKVKDLETTAYALLALSPESISRDSQISVMKWISQQQNEKGGFYSTQDTVITLRALIENAGNFPTPTEPVKVKIYSKEKSPVDLSLEINPENQLVSNTFEIGCHNESDITSLNFGLESSKPVCVSVHITSIYNVPEPKKVEEIFAMDISVDQGGSSATALCTIAHTSICLRQTNPKGTGMLLVGIQLPSGWTVTMSELSKIPLNGDLQKFEFIAEKQEVNVYLNGFENGVEDTERCFTVPLHQRTYVQDSQPGLVTIRNYYNPDEKMERTFQLDSCQLYWESSMGGPTNDTTEKPVSTTTISPVTEPPKEKPICPTCADIETSVMREYLNNSLCLHQRQFFVFKKYNNSEDNSVKGLMYSFNYGNQLASWNTTLNVSGICKCNVLEMEDIFGIFGTNIYAGDLNVDLAGRELVNFDTTVKAAVEFKKVLEVKMNSIEESDKKYWCYGRKAFFALIKKLAPTNDDYSSK